MENQDLKTTNVQYQWWNKPLAKMLKFSLYFLPLNSTRTRIAVLRNGKVLLVKNRLDIGGKSWDLPGGGCKYRESPVNCAARELREELGVSISIDKFEKITTYQTKLGLYSINYEVFSVKAPADGYIKNSKELLDVQWFDVNYLPANVQQSVIKALAKIDQSDKLY